jgi:F420-dependent oxidoreductase-like protein
MKFGALLPWDTADAVALADQVVAMEEAGLDAVWMPEPYGFDAVSILGYLAARTRRVGLGTGIVPVFSRTPTTTAMSAAGLDWVSGGRALLGLGVSGPQVVEGWHGVAYDRPLRRTRETIEICRRVWRRESLAYNGSVYQIPLPSTGGTGLGKRLKLMRPPVRSSIPVYVAALGTNNVALTAEIADGWLPLFYSPARAGAVWGSALREGRRRRDAAIGPLEICAGAVVAIGEDAARHRELVRDRLALYIGGMGASGHNFYNELFQRYGYEREAQQIQSLYLSGRQRDAGAAITPAMLEEVTLCGPAGYVREKLAAYREAGVTMLNLEPESPEPVKTLGALRDLL